MFGALVLGSVVVLSACDDSGSIDKEPGQALVSVDGEEITILQLNDELSRARIQADQLESAKKQILESMIDRQLLMAEAKRNKLDRAPNVMQAIERAKSQIIAQAHLQSVFGEIEQPSKSEISMFYQDHPEIFAQRKQYNFTILRFPANELNDELESTIDMAKSLDDVVKWLDKNNIPHVRDKIARSSAQIPPEMNKRLQGKNKGAMFLVSEKDDSLLVSVDAIEENPVAADKAEQRIGMHLLNKKQREAAQAELARLRSSAEIDYFLAAAGADDQADSQSVDPLTAETDMNSLNDNTSLDNMLQNESIERGITGLK
ncbi:MAG: hypothetical protein NMNS02_04000 [Nitrosomonas sp.]|nr:MAG: hypothetical protein NMNS02_04000 [Nitrosomonas sp.]